MNERRLMQTVLGCFLLAVLMAFAPAHGRYVQPDPLGLDAGLNRFIYVDADPLNYSDPDGLTRRPGGPSATRPMFPPLGVPPPTAPTGSKRLEIDIRRGSNPAGEVDGRPYSGHAFDRMQGRGIPPSVVSNTLLTGQRSPGSTPGTAQYYDPVNNVTVVVNTTTGRIVTVHNGEPRKVCP